MLEECTFTPTLSPGTEEIIKKAYYFKNPVNY